MEEGEIQMEERHSEAETIQEILKSGNDSRNLETIESLWRVSVQWVREIVREKDL